MKILGTEIFCFGHISKTHETILGILATGLEMPHWQLKKELERYGVFISENSVARRLREVGEKLREHGFDVVYRYLPRRGKQSRTTLYRIEKQKSAVVA